MVRPCIGRECIPYLRVYPVPTHRSREITGGLMSGRRRTFGFGTGCRRLGSASDARSAPTDTGNQPRGYPGLSLWLVTGTLFTAISVAPNAQAPRTVQD